MIITATHATGQPPTVIAIIDEPKENGNENIRPLEIDRRHEEQGARIADALYDALPAGTLAAVLQTLVEYQPGEVPVSRALYRIETKIDSLLAGSDA